MRDASRVTLYFYAASHLEMRGPYIGHGVKGFRVVSLEPKNERGKGRE